MKNILSYQQPLPGKEIKDWIAFHTANETEYTPIAIQMRRYDNICDEEAYRIIMHPRKSWHGKEHKYKPIITRLNKGQNK